MISFEFQEMRRLYFFVALNRPWQLIKAFKTKFWLWRSTQLTVGTWWIVCLTSQMSFRAILHLFLTYKCIRKPLLGNLFVIDRRIFFGRLRHEDIQHCHSWKLKTAGGWNLLKFLQVLLTVSMTMFSNIILRFAVYCFTNIVSSVRVSLSKKSKDSNLKESIIDFSVRTE